MTFLQVLKKYFSIVLEKKWTYIAAMLMFIIGFGMVKSIPVIYGLIIDALEKEMFDSIALLIVALFSIKMIGHAIVLVGDHLIDKVLLNSSNSAKLKYVNAVQQMDYEYHTGKSSGSLISLAKRGDNALFTAVIQINLFVFSVFIEFVIALTSLYFINTILGTVTLVILVISLLLGSIFIRLNVKRRNEANKVDDKISGLIADNMIGFETVKVFAQEKYEIKRFNDSFLPWLKAQMRYVYTFRYLDSVIFSLSSINLVITLLLGVHLIQTGEITLGAFVTAMAFIFNLTRGLADVIFNIRDLAKNYTDLKSYFEVMNLKPKITDKENAVHLQVENKSVEFSNVAFSYNKGVEVLSDINVSIEDGQTIALVGESGSGKTTFTRLLLRFYDPVKGSIRIDDHDIKDITLESLRKSIGVVPQEPVLFNNTIASNIAYGKTDATQAQIEEAAEKAQLHKFIQTLPEKYNTVVGERGIKLSGGQKQRLAIARVILENPPIVIFDEATSQLDSKTEKKVQKAFYSLIENKTTIIIAHRLSTITSADKIFVFDNGKIAEEGKHSVLIAKEGIYKKLWDIQTQPDILLK